jgi:hypothetical protein
VLLLCCCCYSNKPACCGGRGSTLAPPTSPLCAAHRDLQQPGQAAQPLGQLLAAALRGDGAAGLAALEALRGAGGAGRGPLEEARDRRGRTALHAAAAAGLVELVAGLLALGADAGAVDKSGETALHGAVRAGSPESLAYLLAAPSAALDAQSRGKGDTALILACCHAQQECRALLEAAGVDRTLTTRNGWDAERWARSSFAARSAAARRGCKRSRAELEAGEGATFARADAEPS